MRRTNGQGAGASAAIAGLWLGASVLWLGSCSVATPGRGSSGGAGDHGGGGAESGDMSIGNAYADGSSGGGATCVAGQTPMMCASPIAANAGCGPTEICDNGIDDNCDGHVDENCFCSSGDVQRCFLGPPGKRGKGACTDGVQTCLGGEFGKWGDCVGSVGPSTEVCDALDNDCDGCVDDGLCCASLLACPAPGDPRIAPIAPFTDLQLRGEQFFMGAAASWKWTIEGGPCDRLFASPDFTPVTSPPPQSFALTGSNMMDASVRFTLSGDYTVTLTAVDSAGNTSTCKWVQHVVAPGIRFELCWDHQGTSSQKGADLDLHVHKYDGSAGTPTPWFSWPAGTDNPHDCYYANCKARSYIPFLGTGGADFGYGTSPLANCSGSKNGSDWLLVGHCTNPRLDVDNVSDVGVPENTNIDKPQTGDSYRAAVHYYSGSVEEHPIVNIYCGGTLKATYGQKPDQIAGFNYGSNNPGSTRTGMIWRVADVQATGVSANGDTTCTVMPLHPPATSSGYWVVTDKNNTDFSY